MPFAVQGCADEPADALKSLTATSTPDNTLYDPFAPASRRAYFLLSANFRGSSSDDLADFYAPKPPAQLGWHGELYTIRIPEIAFGWSFSRSFSLESVLALALKSYTPEYPNGGKDKWFLADYGLLLRPTYSVSIGKPDYLKGKTIELKIGADLGVGVFRGSLTSTDGNGQKIGSSNFGEEKFVFGPIIRLSYPALGPFGIQVTGGYRWEKFDYLGVESSNGIRQQGSPMLLNARNEAAYVDFSGPYFGVGLVIASRDGLVY